MTDKNLRTEWRRLTTRERFDMIAVGLGVAAVGLGFTALCIGGFYDNIRWLISILQWLSP